MSRLAIYKFRLYVAGEGPNSAQARANLAAICREYLPDRHQIEIIDVINDPERALADRIFMTPTLVKLAPRPVQCIVGTLSQKQIVLQTMGMESIDV
ncbi:circadian clock KaiB family protein [Thermomonas sp.]|uniref:circadian clock KaiB family protein n=1 Tax=Thermomonas sp. TaxID=1971895 RepID=UPI002486F3D9|nr:circadian clock KaiB family protein [Thermomonas sp.]MDI1251669.1 circadian clock KaiB family protein [Thermomonas sp.]